MSLSFLIFAAAVAQQPASLADAQQRLRSAVESSVVEGRHFVTSSDGACTTTYAWVSAGKTPAQLLRTEGITIHWDQVLAADVGTPSSTPGFQHWIKAQTSNGYWDVHVSADQVAKALQASRDLVRLCNSPAMAKQTVPVGPARTVTPPVTRPAPQPAPAAPAITVNRNYIVGRWTLGTQSCEKTWVEFSAGGRFTTGGGYAGTWSFEGGRLVAIDEAILDYIINSDVRAIDRQSMTVGGSTFRRCG